MSFDPLILFLIAGMASPGPNIIMLTSSGARFGFRATVPHLLGVVIGVGILGAVNGFGIGALLLARPELRLSLQIIAALWILWMAWGMLRAQRAQTDAAARPMGFVAAVLFQWVNPKIWAVALAASSAYGSDLPPQWEALRIGVSFSCVNFFVCTGWTVFGHFLARLMETQAAWDRFNLVMAVLLAASAALVFL